MFEENERWENQNSKFSKIATLFFEILALQFCPIFFFCPLNLEIISRFYFIHISVARFERKEKMSHEIEKKLSISHILIAKKVDLNVDEFYLMRGVSLKSF